MAEQTDKDEHQGRLLVAFKARIESQQRTLQSLEDAIGTYPGVILEIARIDNESNMMQEQTDEISSLTDTPSDNDLRQFDEISTMQTAAVRQHSDLAARINVLLNISRAQRDEILATQAASSRQYAEILSRTVHDENVPAAKRRRSRAMLDS